MSTFKHIVTAGTLLLVAAALAACSPSGPADQTPTTAPSSSAPGGNAEAKAAAAATVAEYNKAPTARTLEPLSTKPPTGKRVITISCPLPVCATVSGNVTQAVEALGWEHQILVAEFDPESYASAFDTAVQLAPDYVEFISTQPVDVVSTQLAALKAAGIPVVITSPGLDTQIGGDSPLVGAVDSKDVVDLYAGLQAAVVIADADDLQGTVTYMLDPSSPSYVVAKDVFTAAVAAAGGTVNTLEFAQADVGTTLPGQVVSYLQRNPNTEYLVAPLDSHFLGVVEAIQAAQLDLPKLIGAYPDVESSNRLRTGTEFAVIVPDVFGAKWDAVDIFARLSVGDPIPDNTPVGNAMIATKDTVDLIPTGLFQGAPGAYLKAWHVE